MCMIFVSVLVNLPNRGEKERDGMKGKHHYMHHYGLT